jgi:hypothetical protein
MRVLVCWWQGDNAQKSVLAVMVLSAFENMLL